MGICYCLFDTGRENYIQMKDECPICLEVLGTKYIQLECNHYFHKKCIKKWFKKDRSCPQCRHIVKK